MEKKPAQKYSSLLGPVDDVASPRPRTSSNASQARPAQRYESMLSPADAPNTSNTASPRYSSIVNPGNNLLVATGSDAPPPYQPAQPAQPAPARRSPSPAPSKATTPDDDVGPDSDELVPPDMLLLAGTEIYGTKTPHAPPIYRLNLAIGHLRESNMTVSFSRLDYRGHAGAAHAPRERHMYNLRRLPRIMMPKWQYHLEALTRSTLGHVGLHTHKSITGSGYRAFNLTRPNKAAEFVQGDTLFDVKVRKGGHTEWRSAGDKSKTILAYETAEDGIFRLTVVEAVTRKTRDALVATWCLKLWWEIAVSNVEPVTWEEVKRILQTRTNEFPIGTGAGY
ncbi:hypothetical protein B0T11DRAFT_59303 [Plectosphaerella cucumerina]|uniref:Uncharacterized protein n=1 Tax=Plectosphaerella cucumerina TaxID=40658 RepID=A0A8K0TM07_9PEZI|nr:hypothetical protein B0T11DRAFT_59303 [Plectosphaerella cucumerina]